MRAAPPSRICPPPVLRPLTASHRQLRVALIGSASFGFRQPFAGGMEAHTWDLALGLRRLGHQVTVYAGPGSDPELGAVPMWDGELRLSGAARRDVSMQPEAVLAEHIAYQRTMLGLLRSDQPAGRPDVVHLNCVHALPVAMVPVLDLPVTATLHSPPTPWLELAYRSAREEGRSPSTVAVSTSLARDWQQATGWLPDVITNGVDVQRWRPGAGQGGYAVWSGRLVPEKAPHLAIDAARLAGIPLKLAGPAHDQGYFDDQIAPRLGSGVSYLGHLRQPALAKVVGAARVALVTPAWEEPFGLVAIEAMACGTPVVAVARGALVDLIDAEVGALAAAEAGSLAAAIQAVAGLDRATVRQRAVHRFDVRLMVRHYERLLLDAVSRQGESSPLSASSVSNLPLKSSTALGSTALSSTA